MTVGAVTSYSSTTLYQYFGTSISTENIQALMQEYHVSSTGNATDDIKNLYKAMSAKASQKANSIVNQSNSSSQSGNQATEVQSAQSNNVPWATLMSQVGLSVTGNLATDYTAFTNTISAMQVSATSQQEKASINQLEAEASIVFVQQGQSETKGTSNQIAPRTVTGADIQAAMNKLLILG